MRPNQFELRGGPHDGGKVFIEGSEQPAVIYLPSTPKGNVTNLSWTRQETRGFPMCYVRNEEDEPRFWFLKDTRRETA